MAINCSRCGTEMKVTTAFRLPIDDFFGAAPSLECRKCGMLYVRGEWLDLRTEPTDGDDTESEETADLHDGHVGFWLGVGEGEEPIHVLGDPNMSDETAKALSEIAKAARRAIDRDDLP